MTSVGLSASDREKQCEELEVLQAVYGEDLTILQEFDEHARADAWTSRLEIRLADFLSCEISIPCDYPSARAPTVVLRCTRSSESNSSKHDSCSPSPSPLPVAPSSFEAELEAMRSAHPCCDEVLVFQYIEFLKEHVLEAELARMRAEQKERERRRLQVEQEEHATLLAIEAMQLADAAADHGKEASQRVSLYEEADSHTSPHLGRSAEAACPAIHTFEPLTDRKSTFQAHVATVHSVDEARAVIAELLSHPKIARATHNMMAYVVEGADGVVRRENDDDGEDQAGSRLAHLLHLMRVTNVIVVVSRWYGGILLGADRFKHINSLARQGLEAHLAREQQATSDAAADHAAKKKNHAKKPANKR